MNASGNSTSPTSRPFRFGLVGGAAPDEAHADAAGGTAWSELARKAESLGFSSLLLPDAPGQVPETFPMLAWAAASTTTLHVGTYVLSNDLHHPLHVARDAATLAMLSGGRFELGIGAGRPGSEADHRAFGLTWNAPGIRFARLKEAVGIISDLFAGQTVSRDGEFYFMEKARLQIPFLEAWKPPVLIAGSGDRMLRFAGQTADIVGFGFDPAATLDDVRPKAAIVREAVAAAASGRGRIPEMTINLAGAGEVIHPWLRQRLEPRRAELVAAHAPALMLGSVEEMTDQAHRLRDELGVTYITAPAGLIDQLAPVVRELT